MKQFSELEKEIGAEFDDNVRNLRLKQDGAVPLTTRLSKEVERRKRLPTYRISVMRDEIRETIANHRYDLEKIEAHKTLRIDEIRSASQERIDHASKSIEHHEAEVRRLADAIDQEKESAKELLAEAMATYSEQIGTMKQIIRSQEEFLASLARDITPEKAPEIPY